MEAKKKKVLLTGAAGSIGTQTLDVLRHHKDEFELVGICTGSNAKALQEAVKEFDTIKACGISKADALDVPDGITVYTGEDAMADMAENLDYDILVNAVVGFRGLKPTLKALERSKEVALANKESLVCGGDLVRKALKEHGGSIVPIDSEHSAIAQCLQGSGHNEIEKLIITASGGSFRDKNRKELEDVTVEQALKHPSWNMGARITIDSATMVNKGFEVIEAHYLFDIPFERIETVLHPQSIVHSMVEFKDHAVLAQLGSADMRLPIQFALDKNHAHKREENKPFLPSGTYSLDFKEMDFDRYPMLALAIETGKRGGNAGCVFNGADEEAVGLFLKGEIPFLAIEAAIADALQAVEHIENPDYADLEKSDRLARDFVKKKYSRQ
jgi:1-deoxy-D-xylulose-5-phosphate reductoisomerase